MNIESVAEYGVTNAATSYAVTLPTIVSGETLLMLARVPGSATMSTPTGWVEEDARSSGSEYQVMSRVADGTEGSTQTVSTGNSGGFCAVTYSISGVTSVEVLSVISAGDPPSLTASAVPEIWIACMSGRRYPNATAAPSGYTDLRLVGSNLGSTSSLDCALASSYRTTTGSDTENPGAFTYSGGDGVIGATIALLGPAIVSLSGAGDASSEGSGDMTATLVLSGAGTAASVGSGLLAPTASVGPWNQIPMRT